jgi:hypothetical protein
MTTLQPLLPQFGYKPGAPPSNWQSRCVLLPDEWRRCRSEQGTWRRGVVSDESRRECWKRAAYSLLLQSPCTRSSELALVRTRTQDCNNVDISDGSQPLNHALEAKASINSFLASPTEHPPLSRQILFKLPSAPNAPRWTAITLAPLRPAAQFHIRRPNRGIKKSTGFRLGIMQSYLTIYIILQRVTAAITYAQSAHHVAVGRSARRCALLGPGDVQTGCEI